MFLYVTQTKQTIQVLTGSLPICIHEKTKGYLTSVFVHREGSAVWGCDAIPVSIHPVHQPMVTIRSTCVQP